MKWKKPFYERDGQLWRVLESHEIVSETDVVSFTNVEADSSWTPASLLDMAGETAGLRVNVFRILRRCNPLTAAMRVALANRKEDA